MKRTRIAFSYLLAILWAAFVVNPLRGEITLTKVGSPAFDVVDTYVYAAPAEGSFQTLYPNHFPRVPHEDFEHELSNGLAATAFSTGDHFTVSDIQTPSAIHLGYMVVPNGNAPQGSTQDYASGPIVPNASLPILVRGDAYVDGALFESGPGAFSVDLPPIDGFEGRSHFAVDNWDNDTFARPDLINFAGDYEYRLTIRDATNSGYDMVSRFSVVPEPVFLPQLFMIALLAVAGRARRVM